MKTLFLALVLVVVADPPKPIALHISPRIAMAPADLTIQVRVHAHPEDRWISVAMDNGEFRRSSFWDIEPDRTLYVVEWKSVPAGDYDIEARIGHGEWYTGRDRQSVQLMGGPR